MNNTSSELILRASLKWMEPIEAYLDNLYFNKWLPSHDKYHHLRVWQNAVSICLQLDTKQFHLDQTFFEELIITCLFHDTGLILDQSERHGKESRRITNEFLNMHKEDISFNMDFLLQAIENHDDKNYHLHDNRENLLLEILSIADDVDALGATGLYRYIEIYLMRRIRIENIPEMILSNVANRYNNLENCLLRFKIPSHFYQQQYQDLNDLIDINAYPESPGSLVQWINNEIVTKRFSPGKIILEMSKDLSDNQRINAFIKKYLAEEN